MEKYTQRESLPQSLRTWAEEKHLGEDDPHYAFFTLGNLALYVGIGPDVEEPDRIVASTYIERQLADDGSRRSKTPTTALYRNAATFMRDWATQHQEPVDYTFETSNPHMIGWAKQNGVKIFGKTWQVEQDRADLFVAHATFSPPPKRRR